MGKCCNPAVTQVLPEILLPAEMAGVCDSSCFWFLGPCSPCWCAGQEEHITGMLDTKFHSDMPAAGELAGKMGTREDSAMLRVCSQIPPWTSVVHGTLCPLGPPWEHQCPCVTWTPGTLALWGLQPSEHLWRKLKSHRQVPYPRQFLETDQQSARELSGSSWEAGTDN